MIYVNDCSIRVIQYCIKIFMQEIFVQILQFYNEKKHITVLKFDSYGFLTCKCS